ncbi:CCD81 protein, partial [Eudromia elegans]|nr:CCD81 protein [Eudromia elegans]
QGVLVESLGTFCTVQEPLSLGAQGLLMVRRPVFKLGVHMACPQEFTCPEVTLPDGIQIEPLKYQLLSLVTSLPRRVVEACVEETVHFSFHLENRQNVAFMDIGVLSRQGDTLCMMFYASCIQRLEKRASLFAALRS